MTQEQFEITATERVKSIIDYISQGKFDQLSSVTLIDSSWCEETQADGIRTFEEWLNTCLALWSEDEGKEFVVDAFHESGLELDPLENGRSFATYTATSHGEELDFWFEIKLYVNDQDELISEFHINI